MKDSVCCIIVTYNIGERFYNCYNAIYKQVEKLVIVDNGSNSETVSILKQLEKNENTSVIYNDENLGIATALNIGVEIAKKENYKWVLTMDNDSIASEDMVKTMISEYEYIDCKDEVVSLFPNYIDLGINEQRDCVSNQEGYEFINAEITSGNLIKTDVFKELGGFEEKLFIDMVDYEFCFRIRKQGYKLVRLNKAILYHNLGNMTVKKVLGKNMYCTHHNYIRRYYITRNRFYTWNKYKDLNVEELSRDKKFFYKDIIKIVLLEEDKIKKIKMMIKGYNDYKHGKYGKLKN